MKPLSDTDAVDLWKLEQLDGLGFTSTELTALLHWNADYREVKAMRAAGCEPHLVLRILMPLEIPVPDERPVEAIVDAAIQENASIRA